MSSDRSLLIGALAGCGAAIAAQVVYCKLTEGRPSGSTKMVETSGERKYLIAGNWKCNGTLAENEDRIQMFNKAGPIPSTVEIAICAPYVHLPVLLKKLRKDISVGAQDCGCNPKAGAFTGQVGAFQLADLGCTWVIVGHSECREGFGFIAGETVDQCATKCKIALDAGLNVMFAIGEKKEDRELGKTMDVCAKQLSPLANLIKDWSKVAIAYEPVWAIGTGITATPEMAQDTHKLIRNWISKNVSPSVAKAIRIQYGGSMKGSNAKALLAQPDIDGGLIGGASLKDDFFNVINGVPQ